MTNVPPMPEYHDVSIHSFDTAEWTLINKLQSWGTLGWAKVQELEAKLIEAQQDLGDAAFVGHLQGASQSDEVIRELRAKLEDAECRAKRWEQACSILARTSDNHQAQSAALAEALERYVKEVPLGHQPHMLAHIAEQLVATYREGR